MRDYRVRYNKMMMQSDIFFKEFGGLDEKVYAEGAGGSITYPNARFAFEMMDVYPIK